MDAKAMDALSVAVGHSMPCGLVRAMAEIESLRAQVADLQKDNERLERELKATEILAFEGRIPFAPRGQYNGSTWREQLVAAVGEIDRLDDEADKWYEKYAKATRCPPGRSRRGPYVRPSERPQRR